MLRLYLLFLAFIINTTLMFVFLFYYVCFMLENRKHEKIDSLRDEE